MKIVVRCQVVYDKVDQLFLLQDPEKIVAELLGKEEEVGVGKEA